MGRQFDITQKRPLQPLQHRVYKTTKTMAPTRNTYSLWSKRSSPKDLPYKDVANKAVANKAAANEAVANKDVLTKDATTIDVQVPLITTSARS